MRRCAPPSRDRRRCSRLSVTPPKFFLSQGPAALPIVVVPISDLVSEGAYGRDLSGQLQGRGRVIC